VAPGSPRAEPDVPGAGSEPAHLVEILLPVRDEEGQPFEAALHEQVRRELVERFGGLTAWSRAPATGLWKEDTERVARDDIAVYEVLVPRLEPAWWAAYRRTLEERFRQDQVLIRASEVRLL
jgi:hypothetical protein